MARNSPLKPLHDAADALTGRYGPADSSIEMVEAFDPVEIEYAAIRRHAALLDLPSRGLIEVRGPDRLAFLNRMLTQELKPLEAGSGMVAHSFWLSRKGRIDADLRIIAPPQGWPEDRAESVLLLELDVHAVARTLEELSRYVITEDVALRDVTDTFHRFAVHGPAGCAIMGRLSQPVAGSAVEELPNRAACVRRFVLHGGQSTNVLVCRDDSTGEIGLELVVAADDATGIYEALSTPWAAREGPAAPQTELARRIGWHAYNLARIEAGTPLYLLDFGPDSLPHETGDQTLADRVSFKKGCYLGQEIVARMQSLGHPKQKLVGLLVEQRAGAPSSPQTPQAVTGTPVVEGDSAGAAVVGAVTSSAFSPLRGGAPVCFAMMKFSHATAGRDVWLQLDGTRLSATVQPTLGVLSRS